VSLFSRKSDRIPEAAEALAGRDHPSFEIPAEHDVLAGKPLVPPFPDGIDWLLVGMGCFWGAERVFWETPGVWTTSVGYAGGSTPNPTYREVCSGRTGHTEAVLVAYDPSVISTAQVLQKFWEGHDPTQGMRQGNDVGSQYRSAIYWTTPGQEIDVTHSEKIYQAELDNLKLGPITTEIASADKAGPVYYAENYHQQYLSDAKNPRGWCGIGPNGLTCPVGAQPAGRF